MRVRVPSALILAACLLAAVVAVSATEVDAELPGLGQACKAFGAVGTCKAEASCTNGRSYYGFCAGASNVKCCIPAVLKSNYAGKSVNKITQTRADRLKEAEHQAKFSAFKAKNRKVYSSPAVEAQRYEQFKVNREAIVSANDRAGRSEAVYRSTSPFADIPPAVFRQQYLTLKPTSLRSLLEVNADDVAQQTALLEMNGWAHNKAEADSDAEAEVDAEADAEAETETEAETELEVEGPNPKCDAVAGTCMSKSACKGTIWSGRCVGKTDFCCVPAGGAARPKPAPTPAAPNSPESCAAVGNQCLTWSDCYGYGGQPQSSGGCGANTKIGSEPAYCCTMPTVPKTQKELPGRLRTTSGTLTIDYRDIQSPIKHQQSCGSCWAHAAVEVYETAGVRAGKWTKDSQFSVQQLVDCATTQIGASGCRGAWPDSGLNYLSKSAPATVTAYPYKAADGACQAVSTTAPVLASYGHTNALGTSCYGTSCTVERMKEALEKYGPMLVTVDATNWQHYDGSVFPNADCTDTINHAVVLIGYGTETDPATGVAKPFWLVRNSWGLDWGEKGNIRLDASSSTVGCKVAYDGVYATF